MGTPYKVRGGIEKISDPGTTTGELKQTAKEIKELGTVDASFSRGELYLLEDEVVFAQSINESTVANWLNNIFSVGPFNPLQTFGLYRPFETSLEDADKYDGSWRLPYSDIEAVSLLSKSNGYEIFLRPTGNPGYLYRIRKRSTDPIGFRWLYSPSHDTAVQLAGELFDQAARYGDVEEFNPGGHFVPRTKTVEFPKGESKYANKEPVRQTTTGSTADQNRTDATETTASPDDSTLSDSLDWMDSQNRGIRVLNETEQQQRVEIGCRTASDVVFDEASSLDTGNTLEWNSLPDEQFQVGIVQQDGIEDSKTFDPSLVTGWITIRLTDSGIVFSAETQQQSQIESTDTANKASDSDPPRPEDTDAKIERKSPNESRDTEARNVAHPEEESLEGQKPTRWGVVLIIVSVLTPTVFVLSPLIAPETALPEKLRAAAVYTPASQLVSVTVVYGLITNQLSLPFDVISPIAVLLVNSSLYVGLTLDALYVRRRTDWTPRLRYYLPGILIAWFITIPIYLYRRYNVSKRYTY